MRSHVSKRRRDVNLTRIVPANRRIERAPIEKSTLEDDGARNCAAPSARISVKKVGNGWRQLPCPFWKVVGGWTDEIVIPLKPATADTIVA